MEVSNLLVQLIILFFPGIICTYIVNHLTSHTKTDQFHFLLQSFAFGLASYLAYWSILKMLNKVTNKTYSLTFLLNMSNGIQITNFKEILFVSLCAIFLSVLISYFINYRLLTAFARLIRASNKFGEDDVWAYLMNNIGNNWVTIRDHKNNLAYMGWINYFSDTSENPELFLKDVSVYDNNTGDDKYTVEGLYIARDKNDLTIEVGNIKPYIKEA